MTPHLRVEKQPGPTAGQRRYLALDSWSGAKLLHIPCGEDLYESLERWLRNSTAPGAVFRLLGGAAVQLKLLSGKPSDTKVATWSGPHSIACPAVILGGHGTIGGELEAYTTHTHAVFLDAAGAARGCHLIRRQCVAGNAGIWVGVFPFAAATFQVRHDPETTFDVFYPERLMSAANGVFEAPLGRVLLVKLHPNEELYEGLEKACREAGIECALILSGVGSLNDAWLTRNPVQTGEVPRLSIAGPGLEIAGVTGIIHARSADSFSQSQLTAWVTRADGTVTGGELARGLNAVCITFEFTLLEALPGRVARGRSLDSQAPSS